MCDECGFRHEQCKIVYTGDDFDEEASSPTTNIPEPLAELEQLRRRGAVLEKMIAVLKKYDGAISCPYHIGLIKVVCRDYATCSECWTAAIAQAEGGE